MPGGIGKADRPATGTIYGASPIFTGCLSAAPGMETKKAAKCGLFGHLKAFPAYKRRRVCSISRAACSAAVSRNCSKVTTFSLPAMSDRARMMTNGTAKR